jgi:dihydrofolate reductase
MVAGYAQAMMRMIVAVDSAGGMATDSGIPWTLPTDQRFFSDQIKDGVILMGFNTYDEVSAPLHGRTNYVATRRTVTLRDGFVAVPDAAAFIAEHAGETIQNIGGAGLFESTLDLADELVVTRIDADFRCTTFFPPFEDSFRLVAESDRIEENGVTFTFQTWHPRRES